MLPTLLFLSLAAGSALASPAPLKPRAKGPTTLGLKVSNPGTHILAAGSKTGADDAQAETNVDSTSDDQSIYYSLNIDIGTPPQTIEVLMDTGSTKTVVWSDLCDNVSCNTKKTKFSPSASSTFNWTDQDASITYGGNQEYSGKWGTDTIKFGGLQFDNYGFQVITSSNKGGDEIKYGAGVLGLSWTRKDGDPSRSITQKIADDSDDKRFGIYLDRISEASYGTTDETNSELTLNGIDESKIDGEITMVDIYTDRTGREQGWWAELGGLKFGDKEVKLEGKHLGLFDTGTPGILMPADLMNQFYEGIPEATRNEFGVWLFPCNSPGLNLSIIMGGKEWPIYWGDLLRPIDDTATECRGSVVESHSVAPDKTAEAWLVGATFLKNVYSVYSYSPSQIGFAALKDEYNVRTNRVPRIDGNYPDGNKPSTASSNKNSSLTASTNGVKGDSPSTVDSSSSGNGNSNGNSNSKSNSNSNNNGNSSSNKKDSGALGSSAPGFLAAFAAVALGSVLAL